LFAGEGKICKRTLEVSGRNEETALTKQKKTFILWMEFLRGDEEMRLYEKVIPGIFLERPNRFIARVRTEEGEEICHVKNTGRCRELLVPGAQVYLAVSDGQKRKTRCDLIAVQKGKRLINMDSQSPNKAALEAIPRLFPGVTRIIPEKTVGQSRLDFYLEAGERKIFMEVKGVTLEEEGVALFPDAPTERGIKHLEELIRLKEEGYETALLLVIQMKGVSCFSPNKKTHPQFAEGLKKAGGAGVQIMAFDCRVTPDSMVLDERVEIRL